MSIYTVDKRRMVCHDDSMNQEQPMNNIRPFTRYHALSEGDVRRQMMEDLMLDMMPAEWFKTIDAIVESWQTNE